MWLLTVHSDILLGGLTKALKRLRNFTDDLERPMGLYVALGCGMLLGITDLRNRVCNYSLITARKLGSANPISLLQIIRFLVYSLETRTSEAK
jgi:hypothetical protein